MTPSISLLGKLKRLMLESMNQNAEKMLVIERDRVSNNITRARKSIFGMEFNEKVTKEQNKLLQDLAIVNKMVLRFILKFTKIILIRLN